MYNKALLNKIHKPLMKAQLGGPSMMQPRLMNDNIPSSVTVKRNMLLQQQAAQAAAYKAAMDKRPTIRQAEPAESMGSRAWNILSHPMTAASYKVKGQDIPDHFERGNENILEHATNLINPFFYLNEGKQAGKALNDYGQQVMDKGLYRANPYLVGQAGMHALNALPLLAEGKAARSASRLAAEAEQETAAIGENMYEHVDPETGESSFGPKPELMPTMTTYGRDDRGLFRRAGNNKEYILDSEPISRRDVIAGRERDYNHPSRLTRDQYESLSNDYSQNQNTGRTMPGLNIHPDDVADLFSSVRNNTSYDDFMGEQARNAFSWRSNNPYDQSLSNDMFRNMYEPVRERIIPPLPDVDALRRLRDSQRPAIRTSDILNNFRNSGSSDNIFKRAARQVGSGLNKLDEQLGSLVSGQRSVPEYDKEALIENINNNLAKGYGIKKYDVPLQVKLDPTNEALLRSYTPDEMAQYNRGLQLKTYIGDQQVGGLGLTQNTAAYGPKKLSDILLGPKNAFQEWKSTPGFMKKADFPFKMYDEQSLGAVNNPTTGQPFTKQELMNHSGISGEYNKAINEAIKQEGLGNILSGGTGHTAEGLRRWNNLVSKDVAKKFGDEYYMLKKQGGVITDPRGQWAHPGEVTRIPSNDITMQGVNYPVYGIPDHGQPQMMYPGGEYHFPGASHVTEHPMIAQGGGQKMGPHRPTVKEISQMPPLSMQDRVENWLGKPMQKAQDVADQYALPGEEQSDNFRHPMAGRYVSEAIQDKLYHVPVISQVAGFLGASAAGLGHEVIEPNRGSAKRPYSWWDTIKEGAEDQFNNMVGAAVGSTPFITPEQKTKALLYLSNKNMLPDGYRDKDNMYIKENGGQMIKRADGSYSKRGLWDNIRANKGSGKKPTPEMLKQEKKIRAEHKQMGGVFLGDKDKTVYPNNMYLPEFATGGITSHGHHFPGYNKPIADSDGKHKKVVLAKVGNKTKIVHFGAKGYSNNYSAKARAAYKSRHAGEGSQSKLTAGYWSYHNLWGSHTPANHAGKHSGHGERYAEDGGQMDMYADGGTNNPGFHALPDYVQHQILSNMAYGGGYMPEMAEGGIHINPVNKGKFTASAKKAGMSVQAFANKVLQNKDHYSSTMVKRANFAKNASKWHADGGPVVGQELDVTPEQLHLLKQNGYSFEII